MSQSPQSQVGEVIAIILILVLLVLGAFYYLARHQQQEISVSNTAVAIIHQSYE